jgi:hypothetical protein
MSRLRRNAPRTHAPPLRTMNRRAAGRFSRQNTQSSDVTGAQEWGEGAKEYMVLSDGLLKLVLRRMWARRV